MKPSAERVLRYLERAGRWVALYELQNPMIGGTSADRRLREVRDELRKAGRDIEWRYSGKPGSRCTYYRLKREPVQLEIQLAI